MVKRNHINGTERKFVYLIQAANGLIKIGVTNDIEQRFKTLNSGSPIELELLGCIESDNAPELEKELHTYFNDKNVRHEWFKLSSEDIDYIDRKYYFVRTKVTYKVFMKHLKVVFDL